MATVCWAGCALKNTTDVPGDVESQGPLAPGSGFRVGDPILVNLTIISPRLIGSRSTSGSSKSGRHLGMGREPKGKASGAERLAPPPKCSLAALWKLAAAQGVSKDVVAIISYNREGYSFLPNGGSRRLKFDFACQPTND